VGPDGQDRTALVTDLAGLALGSPAVDPAAVEVVAQLLPFDEDLDAAQVDERQPRERVVALFPNGPPTPRPGCAGRAHPTGS
jgi:hypothetical protein